ncbi:hypothetical protein ACFL08_02040 [Patescibacteria group bacterium]
MKFGEFFGFSKSDNQEKNSSAKEEELEIVGDIAEHKFHQFESVEKMPSPLRRIVDGGKNKMENDLLLRFGKTQIENNRDAISVALENFLNNPSDMQVKTKDWEESLMGDMDVVDIENEAVNKLSSELLEYVSKTVFNAGSGRDLEKANNVIMENVAEKVSGKFDDPENEQLLKFINEAINRSLLEFKNIIKYSKVSERDMVIDELTKKIYKKVEPEFSAHLEQLERLDDLVDEVMDVDKSVEVKEAASEQNIEKEDVSVENSVEQEKGPDFELVVSGAKEMFEVLIEKRIADDKTRQWVSHQLDEKLFSNQDELDSFFETVTGGEDVNELDLAAGLAKKAVEIIEGDDELKRLSEIKG